MICGDKFRFRSRGRFTSIAISNLSSDLNPSPSSPRSFGVISASPGIQVEGPANVFRHPQPATTFEYIKFDPGKNAVAVQMEGTWSEGKDDWHRVERQGA